MNVGSPPDFNSGRDNLQEGTRGSLSDSAGLVPCLPPVVVATRKDHLRDKWSNKALVLSRYPVAMRGKPPTGSDSCLEPLVGEHQASGAYAIQSGNNPPERPAISSDARPVPSGRIT